MDWVGFRVDSTRDFVWAHYSLPLAALDLAVLTFVPACPAEYLQISDIRDSLTPRESPFVIDNNAGGGFGEPLHRPIALAH